MLAWHSTVNHQEEATIHQKLIIFSVKVHRHQPVEHRWPPVDNGELLRKKMTNEFQKTVKISNF